MREAAVLRDDLVIVLMSATMDVDKIVRYFSAKQALAPVVDLDPVYAGVTKFQVDGYFLEDCVGATPWLVDVIGRSPELRQLSDKLETVPSRPQNNGLLIKAIVVVVNAVATAGTCVLVFLPGLKEMLKLGESLDKTRFAVHILHSSVPREAMEDRG